MFEQFVVGAAILKEKLICENNLPLFSCCDLSLVP
jgi:hypothetical protein